MASRKPHARFLATLAFMGALAGVLIWSKLRLSTNMPRSAYAVPEEEKPAKPVANRAQGSETTAAPVEDEAKVDAPNEGEADANESAVNNG